MIKKSSSCQFGKVSYWDDRYSNDDEQFDWYQRYSALRDMITNLIKKEDKILVVGCGNSMLSEDMLNDGYSKITNIDISEIVIDQMKEKYREKRALKWQCMDVTDMAYEDNTFNAVIDKGTLDSIMCGEDSVEQSEKMCQEVSRILTPGGVFVLFSFGIPITRKYILQTCPDWTVRVHTLCKTTQAQAFYQGTSSKSHFIYVCEMSTPPPESKLFKRRRETRKTLTNDDWIL